MNTTELLPVVFTVSREWFCRWKEWGGLRFNRIRKLLCSGEGVCSACVTFYPVERVFRYRNDATILVRHINESPTAALIQQSGFNLVDILYCLPNVDCVSMNFIALKVIIVSYFKSIQQNDETDCGPACLAAIFKKYGQKLSIAKIRELAATDREGTSAYGLIKRRSITAFRAKPLRPELKRSIPRCHFP